MVVYGNRQSEVVRHYPVLNGKTGINLIQDLVKAGNEIEIYVRPKANVCFKGSLVIPNDGVIADKRITFTKTAGTDTNEVIADITDNVVTVSYRDSQHVTVNGIAFDVALIYHRNIQ